MLVRLDHIARDEALMEETQNAACVLMQAVETYTRFGSTLTISGERDAPRWL
jgi:hypothetical protein